jgi:hypothetical protein
MSDGVSIPKNLQNEPNFSREETQNSPKLLERRKMETICKFFGDDGQPEFSSPKKEKNGTSRNRFCHFREVRIGGKCL